MSNVFRTQLKSILIFNSDMFLYILWFKFTILGRKNCTEEHKTTKFHQFPIKNYYCLIPITFTRSIPLLVHLYIPSVQFPQNERQCLSFFLTWFITYSHAIRWMTGISYKLFIIVPCDLDVLFQKLQ